MWSPAQFTSALSVDGEQPSALALGAAVALAAAVGWQVAQLVALSFESPEQRAARQSMKSVYRPPTTLPVLGNTLDAMYFQRERFVDWLSEQSQAAGGKTWLLSIMGQPHWFVISTPESYEDLCKRQLHVFERGETMRYIFKDFLGEGIIAVDGHKWLQQRKAASHLFSNRMMREIMDAQVIDKSIQFRDVLAACAARGKPVGLKSLISKFTSDVFTKIGFGVELHGLDPDTVDVEKEHPFIEAIDVMCRLLQARSQSPKWLWEFKRRFNLGDEGEAKKHMKVVKDLVTDIILKSLAEKNVQAAGAAAADSSSNATSTTTTTTTSTVDGKTVTKTTVTKQTTTKQTDGELDADALRAPRRRTGDLISFFFECGLTDPQQLQDMAVNFFFAGKDTTSFSLSWLFVMMNRHPRVLRKIREEIAAQLPELASGKIDAPSMEQLGKLTYLEAAVRENLRLNTSMTTRTANQDTWLSDGTFIPKGSVVYVCHYAEARLPATWGQDAAEYKPERWIDEEGKLRHFSPFKFTTFLAGPRQCIGMRFAVLELMTVAAVLLSRFDIKTVEDPFDITYELSVVFPVKGKLMVTVEPAAPLTPAA